MLVELENLQEEKLHQLEEENRNLKSKSSKQFFEIQELTKLVNSYQKIAICSIAFMIIAMLFTNFVIG
ncbi:hypothetical protein KST09_05540 [Fusobacterium animalis]|uniref:hypothetical protein n=1 Tax=Fusobacterium animalis TaxID=76859 RepID=UPI0030CCA563